MAGCSAASSRTSDSPGAADKPGATTELCIATTAADGIYVLPEGRLPRVSGGVIVSAGCMRPHAPPGPPRNARVSGNERQLRIMLDTGKACLETWTSTFTAETNGSITGQAVFTSRCGGSKARGLRFQGTLVRSK